MPQEPLPAQAQAAVKRGGKFVSLGYFATSAVEAALSVARSPEAARSVESQGTLLGMPSGAGVKKEDMVRPAHSFCMCITEGTRNTRKTRPANLCAHISLFHTQTDSKTTVPDLSITPTTELTKLSPASRTSRRAARAAPHTGRTFTALYLVRS